MKQIILLMGIIMSITLVSCTSPAKNNNAKLVQEKEVAETINANATPDTTVVVAVHKQQHAKYTDQKTRVIYANKFVGTYCTFDNTDYSSPFYFEVGDTVVILKEATSNPTVVCNLTKKHMMEP